MQHMHIDKHQTRKQNKQYLKSSKTKSILLETPLATTKLEELATAKVKSPKEWEFFKSQVLHSFMIAEKIGNRSVNLEEHIAWEERLIKLGILERRQEKEETKKQAFKQSIRYDVEMKKPDGEKGKVALDRELLRRAEQQYINTGVVPLGYKKNQKGKIVRNLPTMEEDKREGIENGLENYNLIDINELTEKDLLEDNSFISKMMLIEKSKNN